MWIDGGIHAREWISPATALNVIDKVDFVEKLPSAFLKTSITISQKCMGRPIILKHAYINIVQTYISGHLTIIIVI